MHKVLRFFIAGTVLATGLAGCQAKEEKKEEQVVSADTPVSPVDKQIAELTGALEQQPNNASLYSRRGMLYLEQKAFQEAAADLDKAIQLAPGNGEFQFQKARILRAAGNVPQAMKAAQQAEQLNYHNTDLFVLMGEMYYILREYQKAIDYLNKGLEASPFNEKAYFYKGLVYKETNDEKRAISNLQTAIEQAPDFVDPYNELAQIYLDNKDYAMAAQYLSSGLRFHPTDPFLWYNHGVMLQEMKLPDSAMTSFGNAVYYDKGMYLAHYNLGVLQYNADKYAEAIPHFEAVLRLTQLHPETNLFLADCYEKTNQLEKAQEYYSIAKEKGVDVSAAEAGLARVARKRSAPRPDTAGTRPR